MGAQTQHKTRLQVGCANTTQCTYASGAPKHTSATQTQGTSAHLQFGRANATQGTFARWSSKRKTHPQRKTSTQGSTRLKDRAGGWIRTNFGLEVDFLIRPQQGWGPQRNARHGRKMGAQMQHKAHLQVGHPNATQGTSASWVPQRTSTTQRQGTSASWAPQRNARHVRKMAAQTQNSSATKTSTQGSTRLKDELEDG
jgi:hypothetical protein